MRESLSGLRVRRPVVGLVGLVGLVAVLAWAGLVAAWALASPHGATRGAERVLVAVWCVEESVERCMPPVTFGGEDPGTRLVPSGIIGLGCVAADPARSAACVADRPSVLGGLSEVPVRLVDWRPDIPETRDGRPARFLRSHATRVSDDVDASIVRMRRTNVALAVVLPALVMLLGTARVRRGMTVSAVALVPLGLTLLGSLDTSSWTLTGAAVTWAALLTALEPVGRLRRSLAAAVAVAGGALTLTPIAFEPMTTHPVLAMSVLAAIGIRALDERGRWWTPERTVLLFGALLATLAIWRTTRYVPWELGLLSSEQWIREIAALSRVLGDIVGAGVGPSGYAVSIAPWASLMITTVIVLVGLGVLRAAHGAGRVLLGAAIGFIALQAVHVTVSQGFTVDLGMFAGRHFLPFLVVVLGAGGALAVRGRTVSARRSVALAAAVLTLAHASALRSRLVRSVADAPDRGGWPSATGWWWDISVGPGAVWVLGSVAFAVLASLAVRSSLIPQADDA